MEFILAIDQGTTATTTLIVNRQGQIVAEGSTEYPQHFPEHGYVEHYGHEIKHSVEKACLEAIGKARIKPNAICAIGITNQRETVCLFDRNNNPARPFIVWQCRRSTEICKELKQKGLQNFLHKKTGLHIDPYFSATKLLWLFRNNPSLLVQAQAGSVLFGTIDTFLCHWLSGGSLHITDSTNASRTMLMDLKTCSWSDECLEIFSVPKKCLPTIAKSIGPYGKTNGLGFLPDGIPIASIAGDQQSALFGQTCFQQGDAKATFGTGCFILLNTGKNLVFSNHGLITSVAYHIDREPAYCLEGSAFIAGAAVQFLRDNLGIISSASEIESLAKTVPDNGGVVFVPALCGLGAPYWQPNARGVISGLDRGTERGHIARATLEGIAMQNHDILSAMAKDGVRPTVLKVDGGAAKNDLLMQLQADLLDVPCIRPQSSQKTGLGAAYLAGLALGIFADMNEIKNINDSAKEFRPSDERQMFATMIERYHKVLAGSTCPN